jgi:signal transduction histidine kinase
MPVSPVGDTFDRLRRAAVIHTVVVAVVAGVGGAFVEGESAFLVAWVYTGGAVALPALLVNWMVARGELGSMPGGRAWSAGLVWIYVVGLALLYVAAEPESPLRTLSVVSVLPPIACFAVAAAQLVRGQWRRGSARPGQALRFLLLVAVPLGVATAVGLGDRLTSGESAWLVRPAALVAVATTSGFAVSVRYLRGMGDETRALARLGLAVMALGAVESWAMVAQAASDFALPASPLLVLLAVTLGLLLQIPIHAPRPAPERLVPAERAGPGHLRLADVVSRAWLAEDPSEPGVLPTRLRRPAIVYVAVTAPLAGAAGLLVEGRAGFLVAWVYVSAAYTTPAMVVTWAASRRTHYQVTAWRLWFLAVVTLYLCGAGLLFTALYPDTGVERLAIVAVIPCVALFGVAAVMMMRARSGSRSLGVDIIETSMVMTVICFGVLLVVGEEVWRSDEAWFTVPTAVVTVAVTSGLAWTLMIYTRMPHEDRSLEGVGLALAVVGTVDAWAMLAQGLSGFTLPSAPLLFVQALATGLLFLLPLHVPRTEPPGLEALPPHEQVRNGWAVVAITMGALPFLFVAAWRVRDGLRWAPEMFGITVMVLLGMAMARQALAINETRNLYGQVVRAADERRRLLSDVMRSVDHDRHRVAAQLHEQAIATYAAFSSLTGEAERALARPGSTLLADVSAQLRGTFGDQAETLRRLVLAMQPLEPDRGRSLAERLGSPIRAFVDSLYGDVAAPDLQVEVREELAPDWTTEAIVLRVVQEALGNVRRHSGARHVLVRLDADDAAQLTLTVTDDGCGFDPAALLDERGIATMRSYAALVGASLSVDSRPGAGTVVRLQVRADGSAGSGGSAGSPAGPDGWSDEDDAEPPPSLRPRLRLVRQDP